MQLAHISFLPPPIPFRPGGMGLDPSSGEAFVLDCPACVLQPGESRKALVTFKPMEARPYAARLPLEVCACRRPSIVF